MKINGFNGGLLYGVPGGYEFYIAQYGVKRPVGYALEVTDGVPDFLVVAFDTPGLRRTTGCLKPLFKKSALYLRSQLSLLSGEYTANNRRDNGDGFRAGAAGKNNATFPQGSKKEAATLSVAAPIKILTDRYYVIHGLFISALKLHRHGIAVPAARGDQRVHAIA
ncbi:hypothetical protein [Pantoea anthophila]|uniref:Uncharacterized protein n=1 Tax=Pantoea anthophila TaxID=470931 RepID=A0ABY2Z5N3_9GAMM|nr:hypothetical protein [Pantoea anthophila]TPV21063.1 hypothetical protein FJW00_20570 [Pantoea anthophila]WIM56454.1 hypothetical protein P7T05_07870 [Pantoea anthophila]